MIKRLGVSYLRILMLGLVILLVSACSTVKTTSTGKIGVTRSQTMWDSVSEQELQQQAKLAYSEVINDAKRARALNPDPKESQRVKAITNNIIKQVGVFREDALKWPWEVNVINSDEINAWCMPGGKIAVYTGLIRKMDVTDDELAAVIGHEISHALREHSRERVSQKKTASVGVSLVTILLGGKVDQNITGGLANIGFLLPNSRAHESEADAMGVELAARAAYDPRAAVTLWQKMGQSSGKKLEILSTHPSSATRIKELTVMSEKVMDLYEEALASKKTAKKRK